MVIVDVYLGALVKVHKGMVALSAGKWNALWDLYGIQQLVQNSLCTTITNHNKVM